MSLSLVANQLARVPNVTTACAEDCHKGQLVFMNRCLISLRRIATCSILTTMELNGQPVAPTRRGHFEKSYKEPRALGQNGQ